MSTSMRVLWFARRRVRDSLVLCVRACLVVLFHDQTTIISQTYFAQPRSPFHGSLDDDFVRTASNARGGGGGAVSLPRSPVLPYQLCGAFVPALCHIQRIPARCMQALMSATNLPKMSIVDTDADEDDDTTEGGMDLASDMDPVRASLMRNEEQRQTQVAKNQKMRAALAVRSRAPRAGEGCGEAKQEEGGRGRGVHRSTLRRYSSMHVLVRSPAV